MDSLFIKKVEEDNKIIMNRIKNAFPIKRAIFIDSTWHQTKAIYKDQRLRGNYTIKLIIIFLISIYLFIFFTIKKRLLRIRNKLMSLINLFSKNYC